MKPNESHIIAQIVAGKTEEFSYFLDAYGQQVFALIVRMVSSPEYAEELTQDTFMKAFQHLSSFSNDSMFSTWIYRIAYNTALSALRKKKEEVLVIDDKQWERVSETEIDEALDDESEERIARLQAALEKLAPEERAIITLFYEEEKSIEEIAHILNQSVSNIKVKLHRIRKKLYILMSKEE
jgi:RNA polymerase sigma-70 factor (ECF subfamily)